MTVSRYLVHACALSMVLALGPSDVVAGGGVFSGTGADVCSDAKGVPVEVGPYGAAATTVVFGDNSLGSGGDCSQIGNVASWWERFEISEVANVELELCGTDPVNDPSAMAIFAGCNSGVCADRLTPRASWRGAPFCEDGNIWLLYVALPAGTYYYPVRGDGTVGPYQITILAERQRPLSSGPDLVTGVIDAVLQLGREGPVGDGIVGLGLDTTMCNAGDQAVTIDPLPATGHQLISLNMYRLTTVQGSVRFEQLGQSWLKHTFASNNFDDCEYGCNCAVTGCDSQEVASRCSDAYFAQQFVPCDLGPRSAVNPYTGVLVHGPDLGPSADCDSNFPSSNHIGHYHPYTGFSYPGIAHRLQVRDVDLMSPLNPGARYFAEAHYITSDEYLFANGNQNNNVSHQEYGISGPDINGVFTFAPLSGTVPESPAVDAWTSAAQSLVEPYPLEDGRAFVASEVTDLGGGMWHYEYVVYNMHLDAAIGSFSVPVGIDVNVQNIGFRAPLAHAPEAGAENYAITPWAFTRTATHLTWATDEFKIDPLANAIRFGTAYNFRFDADVAATPNSALVGIFKTGDSVQAGVPAPSPPLGEPGGSAKNRFISMSPPPPGSGDYAIRVRLTSLHHPAAPADAPDFSTFEGEYRYVRAVRDGDGNPVYVCSDSANSGSSFLCAALGCEPEYREWGTAAGDTLHITGSAVTPSSIYAVAILPADCMGDEENCPLASPALGVSTALWGDVDPGQLNVIDVARAVDKVKDIPGAFSEPRILLHDAEINPYLQSVNVLGISYVVDALKGRPYPFTIAPCP